MKKAKNPKNKKPAKVLEETLYKLNNIVRPLQIVFEVDPKSRETIKSREDITVIYSLSEESLKIRVPFIESGDYYYVSPENLTLSSIELLRYIAKQYIIPFKDDLFIPYGYMSLKMRTAFEVKYLENGHDYFARFLDLQEWLNSEGLPPEQVERFLSFKDE